VSKASVIEQGVNLPMAGSTDLDGWAWISILTPGLLPGDEVMHCQDLHLSLTQLTRLERMSINRGHSNVYNLVYTSFSF